MDVIGGCRKRRRCRCGPLSRCLFVAAIWMAAIATACAAAPAAHAEGTDEADTDASAAAAEKIDDAAADEAATALPAIDKPTIVDTGRWLSPPRFRGTVSTPSSTTAGTTAVLWVTHTPSGLPPCHPYHVQPPSWIGQRNTYIDVTESGCSMIVGDPTATASETAAHRPPLTVLRLYDGRQPIPTRHQLREARRHRCSASVSLLLPQPHNASGDDPSPLPPPETEPSSFAQLTDAAGKRGHRRRLNGTRLGGDRPMVVRSFRVRNSTQPQFHVWTSAAVRIDLQGACEPVVHAPYFRRSGRGSLRIAVNYYPETQSICEERDVATAATTRQPLLTGALFANDRRFQSLLPERLRCRGRVDYAAHVRAPHIVVQSAPHPASCRRLCVADRCGAELNGLRLTGEQADGGWVHVRYDSLTRSSAAHHTSRTTTSAAADVSAEENPEEDDDEREHDGGNEDPDADDDVDVIGNSDVSTGGNVTQAVVSRCRNDVYSGFVLLLSPGGRAYLLP